MVPAALPAHNKGLDPRFHRDPDGLGAGPHVQRAKQG
jgi:hypothetical protein